jgi:tol-pal system protein YbgF
MAAAAGIARLRPALRAAALGALLLAAPSLPARAELAALAAERARLADELAGLRRIVPVQATDPARSAQLVVRLGQLEEELRQLTGRIEQLEHGQRNLEQRFDQLIGDLDQRLRTLDPDAAAAPPAPETPDVRGPTSIEPLPGRTAEDPLALPGSEPQTLGRVPQSAVLALPRPDPSSIPPPVDTRRLPAEQQYESAMELLRAGDYAGAERGLQLFLELNPDHSLAANAAYWLAETHYVRKNYAAAAAAFARNYRTYGRTAAKAPDNLLKLGMSLEGLGENDKACLSYSELDKEFPDAPVHIQQALARERARADCA